MEEDNEEKGDESDTSSVESTSSSCNSNLTQFYCERCMHKSGIPSHYFEKDNFILKQVIRIQMVVCINSTQCKLIVLAKIA